MNNFKKYFSIFFVLVMIITRQHSFGQKPSFGIKAGLVFCNMTIDRVNSPGDNVRDKTSTRTGVTGGLYFNIPSGKKLILRPGMEVVSKGARKNNGYSSVDYPIISTYIDFPLNVLYQINLSHGHIIAGGGPFIGVPVKDYYQEYPVKTEFGINALAGYELAIGFSLNLNYSYGLSNASKNIGTFSKISNHYLGATVGYTF